MGPTSKGRKRMGGEGWKGMGRKESAEGQEGEGRCGPPARTFGPHRQNPSYGPSST